MFLLLFLSEMFYGFSLKVNKYFQIVTETDLLPENEGFPSFFVVM